MNFKNRANELKEQIIKDRRYIHENAELSFNEVETTKHIVNELKALGIPVQTYDDYNGCIATIKGGKAGNKTVLLRADIDALPIQEKSGVEFESKNEGVMHACGHDCHASMLLGAARLLWEEKENLQGTVKLLFQSGEEGFIGSHYYVDNGHLDDVDAAMGMHVWHDLPTGKLGIKDGMLMASCDNFKITVHGKSAHGSTPHLGKDAIVAASGIIVNSQTIVSRINDPLNSLAVSFGTVRAGTQFNIVTDRAEIEGTIRAHDETTRQMAKAELVRIAEQTAISLCCTAEVEYNFTESCITNDDIELNELARNSAKKLFGDDVVEKINPVGGSEDFSYIMDRIPASLFLFLGTYDEATGATHAVHNEKFKVNEDILPIGAAQYAQFAADYLDIKGK